MSSAILTAAKTKSELVSVISSAAELASGPVKRKLRRWGAENKIDKLYKQLREFRKVRTFWSMDRDVDLTKFYYPTRVSLAGFDFSTTNQINSISGLDTVFDDYQEKHRRVAPNYVIEGTVGQGKSIFMRYLTSMEMYQGKRIPIFIELRTLHSDKLFDRVAAMIEELGITSDTEVIEHLIRSGHVVLLLDGFDEVRDSDKSELSNQIDRLSNKYKKCQIIISSRPGGMISNQIGFVAIQISPYSSSDLVDVITKFSKAFASDPNDAQALIREIRDHTHLDLGHMLSTPLMATLLVIKFANTKVFPHTSAEFYDDLFDILADKHDRSKLGGVKRTRKSGQSHKKLRLIFDTFCFLTRYDGLAAVPEMEAIDKCKIAIAKQVVKADAEDVLDDISSITCMLQLEGQDYKFVHKSVQEYHASCYIKTLDDELSFEFYNECKRKITEWKVELDFLEVIDERRFYTYFALDGLTEIESFFDTSGISAPVSNEFVRHFYKLSIDVVLLDSSDESESIHAVSNHAYLLQTISTSYFLPSLRRYTITSNSRSHWNSLCKELGFHPMRKKHVKSKDILMSDVALDMFRNASMYPNDTVLDDLDQKLKKARNLSETKPILKNNRYV